MVNEKFYPIINIGNTIVNTQGEIIKEINSISDFRIDLEKDSNELVDNIKNMLERYQSM